MAPAGYVPFSLKPLLPVGCHEPRPLHLKAWQSEGINKIPPEEGEMDCQELPPTTEKSSLKL